MIYEFALAALWLCSVFVFARMCRTRIERAVNEMPWPEPSDSRPVRWPEPEPVPEHLHCFDSDQGIVLTDEGIVVLLCEQKGCVETLDVPGGVL